MAPGGYPVPAADRDSKVKLGPGEEDDEDFPLWKLATTSASWIGIQMLWGTEFSVTQPYMEDLGMSAGLAALTWIWGPITGFIVAPLVGAASDRCESRFGRRRPFMLGGLVAMTICAFLFGAARYIFGSTVAGQVFALIMFIGMDATINVMQTPVRAFISDLCSSRQQSVGQLMCVGFQGVGGLLGAAVMLPYAHTKAQNVFPVVAIALGINFVLMSLACIVGKEKQFRRPEYLRNTGCLEPFTTVFGAVKHMPVGLQRVAIVQFFSWFALFCMWTFKSTWWGTIVFEGCAKEGENGCTAEGAQKYGDGTAANDKIDLIANALQTVLGLVLAIVMQKGLLTRVKFLYSAMLGIGAIFFYINYGGATGHPGIGYFTMSLIAIPICAINAFPFALIGADSRNNDDKEHDTGVQFGVLNLFIVIPQIIVTVANSSMQSAGASEYLFLMVAISWTIACVAALFVKDVFVNDTNVNLVRESLQSAASSIQNKA